MNDMTSPPAIDHEGQYTGVLLDPPSEGERTRNPWANPSVPPRDPWEDTEKTCEVYSDGTASYRHKLFGSRTCAAHAIFFEALGYVDVKCAGRISVRGRRRITKDSPYGVSVKTPDGGSEYKFTGGGCGVGVPGGVSFAYDEERGFWPLMGAAEENTLPRFVVERAFLEFDLRAAGVTDFLTCADLVAEIRREME